MHVNLRLGTVFCLYSQRTWWLCYTTR